ncbi:hypothetical protein ACFONI_09870 [Aeromonas media]
MRCRHPRRRAHDCLMNQQPRVKPAACLTTTAVAASGERIW